MLPIRLIDLKKRADVVWTDREGYVDMAWRHFESSTMSIEILKDDQLQKAYFHVRDKVSLIVPSSVDFGQFRDNNNGKKEAVLA